jgi:cobalt/nickel transport system permease protein
MKSIDAAGQNIRFLDELAAGTTVIHRIDPLVKLLTATLFVIIVASFPKYAVLPMLPLVFYPVVLIVLGNLPVGYLLKRVAAVAPFAVLVGILNPVFDRTPLLQLGMWRVPGGWVSFCSIVLRFGLTVLAALLVIATTGFPDLGAALTRLRLPRVLVQQILFLYRYLFVLLEETGRTVRAYNLRSARRPGIAFRAWGSLLGQLILRTYDRADRIYRAMLCRGYQGELRRPQRSGTGFGDWAFLTGWTLLFLLARWYNIPQLLGNLFWAVGR